MVLAVSVGAVHAVGDGQLAALHAVVPRAEPLLARHLVAAEASQVVDLEKFRFIHNRVRHEIGKVDRWPKD